MQLLDLNVMLFVTWHRLARDVCGLRPLWRVLDGELHLLILVKVSKTFPCNSTVVDKYIIAAVIGRDEAITFHAAEPLDDTGFLLHRVYLLLCKTLNVGNIQIPSAP